MAGFFDGYDPDSPEWRCEPGELEAYPEVAMKTCTGCYKKKETYRVKTENLPPGFRCSGKLKIQIDIVPKKDAESNPVGGGRSEPNVNPYLP